MSASSNITLRPRFKAFIRNADNAVVLVNLDYVREILLVNNVLRLRFSSGGNDHLDVKSVTIEQLREVLAP